MSEYSKYRLLEILPGTFVWATFLLTLIFSFIKPIWVIVFMIVFVFYWLVRLFYMQIFLFLGFYRYRKASQIDWKEKIKNLPGVDHLYHAVFFPTYKEPYEVLHTSLAALRRSQYPCMNERFIVILAGEEGDRKNFLDIVQRLQKDFEKSFFAFLVTVHPKGISGELPGKGSNTAHAGRELKKFIDAKHIPYANVLVSNFDADTQVHEQYFSYLTFVYFHHPRRQRASYQPLPLFNNNVWEAPSFARVVSYSTTFWMMTEQIRPERLFTFSSHAMPFQALVDVGFWQSDIVTEDSRICLQCLQHYDGDYEVVPLYIPVSMDVVVGDTLWETIKSQYVQQRRWAYGVENFPYMVWNFFPNKKIAFVKKFRYMWNQLEGVYSWATAPLLMLIFGRLPLWLLDESERQTTVALNAPHILQILMTVSTVGIIVSAFIGTMLLPPRPSHVPKRRMLYMLFQWPLIIVSLIVFGSIPSTDAQTRLMFGKYLGFDVTKKVRRS
ncbi:MAG: glycosyltransferase family 2 protein [Patescibacteria group bacterium]|jgi:hypothetical protein